MIQRLARDESGMTMSLAIMMILLISVIGAGLLTFVSRDLNSVIEENRGQRAFEEADAGVEAAKRQLASNVVREHYDGLTDIPDIQWSIAQGGLTLNNLDLDGEGATSDSVKVTIEYMGPVPNEFRVISTGTYGDPPQQAKRRIEAIFKGDEANAAVSDALGHPLYYTPSNIKIEATESQQVDLRDISLFSGGDILVQDENPSGFIADMNRSSDGVLGSTGTGDALGNWYSPDYAVDQGRGPWNTEPRKENDLTVVCWSGICWLGSIEIGSLGPIYTLPLDRNSNSP